MNQCITDNKHQERIYLLYTRYTETFKPILATVEAVLEEMPAAILNEIRSFTDHISRCYWPSSQDVDIESNLQQAERHLTRAERDCFKHLLVYHDECKHFARDFRRVDLTLIADGEFYIKYKQMWKEAVNTTKLAKLKETSQTDEACELYENAFNAWCA